MTQAGRQILRNNISNSSCKVPQTDCFRFCELVTLTDGKNETAVDSQLFLVSQFSIKGATQEEKVKGSVGIFPDTMYNAVFDQGRSRQAKTEV